jgi:hypothetical protein
MRAAAEINPTGETGWLATAIPMACPEGDARCGLTSVAGPSRYWRDNWLESTKCRAALQASSAARMATPHYPQKQTRQKIKRPATRPASSFIIFAVTTRTTETVLDSNRVGSSNRACNSSSDDNTGHNSGVGRNNGGNDTAGGIAGGIASHTDGRSIQFDRGF